MDAEENQKQVFPRRPQPLEIAARFPHSHRRDEAVEVENQKQVFPLSTATGWLFRPNSERRPGGGASLLLQAHCSIRKCCPLHSNQLSANLLRSLVVYASCAISDISLNQPQWMRQKTQWAGQKGSHLGLCRSRPN